MSETNTCLGVAAAEPRETCRANLHLQAMVEMCVAPCRAGSCAHSVVRCAEVEAATRSHEGGSRAVVFDQERTELV